MQKDIETIQINNEVYVKQSDVNTINQPDGDYVVVRTYSAGVHAGHLASREGKEVILENTRRLWYWEGAATLSQIAGEGITAPDKCKFPAPIAKILLTEAIEIIPCTTKAKDIIQGVAIWKK